MEHREIRESIPAYALDALGPLDRAEVRHHLETCSDCDRIYKESAEAAALFGITIDAEAPSPNLKTRLMEEVRQTDQALPVGMRKRRIAIPRGAVALGTVAVLVVGLYAVMLQNRFSSEERMIPEVVALLASPSVYSVPMESTEEAPRASAQIFVADNTDGAAVLVNGLHDPGQGVYTLWMSIDGRPVAVTSFEPDGNGKAVIYVSRDLEAMEEMTVTLEESAAAKTPQGPLILRSI